MFLAVETARQTPDKLGVELDQVELILVAQPPHDLGRDRAGAGPDLEHAAGRAEVPTKRASARPRNRPLGKTEPVV